MSRPGLHCEEARALLTFADPWDHKTWAKNAWGVQAIFLVIFHQAANNSLETGWLKSSQKNRGVCSKLTGYRKNRSPWLSMHEAQQWGPSAPCPLTAGWNQCHGRNNLSSHRATKDLLSKIPWTSWKVQDLKGLIAHLLESPMLCVLSRGWNSGWEPCLQFHKGTAMCHLRTHLWWTPRFTISALRSQVRKSLETSFPQEWRGLLLMRPWRRGPEWAGA